MKKRKSSSRSPVDAFARYVRIVRRLRRECPWDRKQTHRSLRSSLIEEAYEVVDTIDRKEFAGLGKELGDLLLHVVLHAVIAEEAGEFTLATLLEENMRKLIRRHPHVFGASAARSAAQVVKNWEALKMREGRSSLLEGVPRHLPALQRAQRVQQRASTVGFDWKRRGDVWKKVVEEVRELETAIRRQSRREREEEMGDLLFALVNYSRFAGIDAEHALRGSIDKFSSRFRYIERKLTERGTDIHHATFNEMDALWDEAKIQKQRR